MAADFARKRLSELTAQRDLPVYGGVPPAVLVEHEALSSPAPARKVSLDAMNTALTD